jgi:hypothetical protein
MRHGIDDYMLVNRTLVRIVGMSRSGNHAIINWMLEQLSGRWCFLNCAEPDTNPFHTARMTDEGRCYRSNDPEFDLDAHCSGQLSAKDCLLVSHEDTFLKPAFGPDATARQLAWVGQAQRRLDVIILRDPYNLFASRRRFDHQGFSDRTMVRMWKQHARAFLGYRRAPAGPVLGVSYNAWVGDRGYRAKIAGKLGLDFTDAGFHDIARCGGGSSFDGYRFDGQAGRMNLFERWQYYREDRQFRALFDAETRAFASRIFGPPPEDLAGRHRSHDTSLLRLAGEGGA